ncbi:hypothetical protein HDE_11001 [Halotydeus destructor]|nr:hypothetical protein HDE_11001 [Halotydeus destructor]
MAINIKAIKSAMLDVLFGLGVVFAVHTYILYRFNVRFYFDREPLEADSNSIRAIKAFVSLIVGFTATRIGHKASNIVRTVMLTFTQIRYGIPPPGVTHDHQEIAVSDEVRADEEWDHFAQEPEVSQASHGRTTLMNKWSNFQDT